MFKKYSVHQIHPVFIFFYFILSMGGTPVHFDTVSESSHVEKGEKARGPSFFFFFKCLTLPIYRPNSTANRNFKLKGKEKYN